jgi:hypothetical protein
MYVRKIIDDLRDVKNIGFASFLLLFISSAVKSDASVLISIKDIESADVDCAESSELKSSILGQYFVKPI